MAELFDIPAEWRRRCSRVEHAALPGGHFFVDESPSRTAGLLLEFLEKADST